MAQLPPKFPAIPPNYFQKNISWADDFLDFSAARRGAHRRSVSDSVALFEPPDTSDFDRLDDEQLISMFSDHVAQPQPPPPQPEAAAAAAVSSGNNSMASDDNSVNAEKGGGEGKMKLELEEEQSQCMDGRPPEGAANAAHAVPAAAAAATEQIVDSKRVKRILANRQSAQRSRVRKLQYISELERSVTTLQTEVSALSPRVAFFDHQRSILTVGNSHLKQRIAALAQDKIFKDGNYMKFDLEHDCNGHMWIWSKFGAILWIFEEKVQRALRRQFFGRLSAQPNQESESTALRRRLWALRRQEIREHGAQAPESGAQAPMKKTGRRLGAQIVPLRRQTAK